MELLTLYHAVAEQLDRLDFAALYPGYHRYPFALYDEEQVCLEGQLFPWDDRFLGNTSIEYEGRRIAIWSVALDPQPPVALAANMAHEMFHCFQFDEGERRFPDGEALRQAIAQNAREARALLLGEGKEDHTPCDQ